MPDSPRQSTSRTVVYWICTILVATFFIWPGAMMLHPTKDMLKGVETLGYPDYLMLILGFWKLTGGIAILLPRFPRLKEWAYAGIFFDLTGAAASHFFVHDPIWHILSPLAFIIPLCLSWALRPPARRLA